MKNQQSKECQLNILNEINSNYVKKTQSIYQLSNDKLVLPRYSKFHLKTKDFFFGIPKKQLDKFNWNNLFILFICDSEKRVFILPATELSWLYNHTPASDGNWKLNIKEESDHFYLYKHGENGRKIPITKYLNNFRLLDIEIEKRTDDSFPLKLSNLPEEVTEYKKYYEGATTQIMVNVYEINPKAREKCLAYYGLDCCICGFNFEKVYGSLGKGFIQVHHLKPLSEIREEYELDPIKDLRPICPNCHAMIHKRKPPYMLDEIVIKNVYEH